MVLACVTRGRFQNNFFLAFTFASHWFVKISKLFHELSENGTYVAPVTGFVIVLVCPQSFGNCSFMHQMKLRWTHFHCQTTRKGDELTLVERKRNDELACQALNSASNQRYSCWTKREITGT